jgi:hypothetical protein
MGSAFKDLKGQRFGRIQILSFHGFGERSHNRAATWDGLCDCGNKVVVFSGDLLIGDTKSCGCWHRDRASISNIKHGFYGKKSTKTQKRFYNIWKGIKYRCLNPHFVQYSDYGGRGIKVCDRWMKFENFRDDMWESYLQHIKIHGEDNTSIDRWPNVNGNYEPSNCRWSTDQLQHIHKRSSVVSTDPKEHKKLKIYLDIVMRNYALCLIKNSKYGKYFGCTPLELHNYLESLWLPGMTWDNYGRYSKKIRRWQIDHIVPANMFDLSLEKDRYLCYNIKNLQPKWADEHMKKSKNKENYTRPY